MQSVTMLLLLFMYVTLFRLDAIVGVAIVVFFAGTCLHDGLTVFKYTAL